MCHTMVLARQIQRIGASVFSVTSQLSVTRAVADYSLTDNFQVALRLFGRIENPAFLIFVKEIQKSRSEDNKLNVFDLMALYKTAKEMSHRNTDSETLNKLLREDLLIEGEEGMKLPALYDEISARVAEQMAERGEMNGEMVGDIQKNIGSRNFLTPQERLFGQRKQIEP